MKRVLIVCAALCALLLALYGLGVGLGLPVDADPLPWLAQHPRMAGALVVALLVADVVLPVPSSLVMIASGACCGAVLGSLYSLAGSLGAAAFAWWLGRRGGRRYERLLSEHERERARAWLERHGWFALAASRPVPIVAEVVALVAGAAGLGLARVLVSALVGALPIAVLYALVGSDVIELERPWLAFVLALAAAAPMWWIGRAWSARRG